MKVEIFEGKRALDYDKNIPVLFPGYERAQERMVQVLTLYIPPVPRPRILVAGCGTGTEMMHLLDLQPAWHVTGIDPSPEMVEKARHKMASYPAGSFELLTGLVAQLPPVAQHDAAILQLVLHFLPDDGSKLSLLKQIAGRLAPGAPFILVDIFGKGTAFEEGMAVLEHLLLQRLSREVVQKMMVHIKHDIHPCAEKRLHELLREAGFTGGNRYFQDLIYGAWVARRAGS